MRQTYITQLLSLSFVAITLLFSTPSSAFSGVVPSVNYTGHFSERSSAIRGNHRTYSNNSKFSIQLKSSYEIDRDLTIHTLSLFDSNKKLFDIKNVANIPVISNSGFLLLSQIENRLSPTPLLTLYSPSGEHITLENSNSVEVLGFNNSGNFLALSHDNKLEIINCRTDNRQLIASGYNFEVSDNEVYSIVASEQENSYKLSVFKDGKKLYTIAKSKLFVRGIGISPDSKYFAYIDRDVLSLHKTETGDLLFRKRLNSGESFKDVRVGLNSIWVGVQKTNSDHSKFIGILRSYSFSGLEISSQTQDSLTSNIEKLRGSYTGEKYPWPFKPQEQAHTVWNGYLALSGRLNANDNAYLHQGLDIEVPAKEPTYSISDGFCKYKGYIMDPSRLYWRVCIADKDISTRTEGWMYAHLIKDEITVDVDDTVFTGQLLGKIIKWGALSDSTPKGHIHLSRISDHGAHWSYTDDEWWNVCDPLALLTPSNDTSAPQFLDAGSNSKFFFSTNDSNSSYKYLDANELHGEIDIIVNMTDKVGRSKWGQPAYQIKWWIKSVKEDKIVTPKYLGLLRNQSIPEYNGEMYRTTLPPVMYRLDSHCTMNSSWKNSSRSYYHTITNNDGDSTITASDINEAFNTVNYKDGEYWIIVELQDEAGNSSIDSQKVSFKNEETKIINSMSNSKLKKVGINSISVNGLNKSLTLNFTTENISTINLSVYDTRGKMVSTTNLGSLKEGYHSVNILNSQSKLSSGIYICKLMVNKKCFVKRFTLK